MPSAPAESKRRLFFALWPDASLRRQMAALSRERCQRPVAAANLHLTLRFLGMQDEAMLPCFCEAAGQVRAHPFTLVLDRYGGWQRKRIQWLGPSSPPAELGELAGALNQALESCAIEAETRPFVPHVTLSRKAKKPLEGPLSPALVWPVDSFVLAESVPSSEGVRYVILERWTL